MNRDTSLKIQYSLRKTYTYNSFRLLNRLNVVFLKNNFNFFYFFKVLNFFFFNDFYFNKLKFSKFMVSFCKVDSNFIFFPKNHNKKYYNNLTNRNYICNYNTSFILNKLYNSVFKINYNVLPKKNLICNNLNY